MLIFGGSRSSHPTVFLIARSECVYATTLLLYHVAFACITYHDMHDLLHSHAISLQHISCALGCNTMKRLLQCNDMHSFSLLSVSLTVIHLPCNRELFSLPSSVSVHLALSILSFLIVNLSHCHHLSLLPAVGSPTLSQYCDFSSYAKFNGQTFLTPNRPCRFFLSRCTL